ncbi:bifunctional tetrahydrofolate synthase/dihydrofolate synthase [Gilvimarinus sp. DA14]|uniref:bifunctional tetrahydrofolate synthase/dihydrofolate synthase n=1 Tax=Gilvimarinus sp. DA14 TaxID=2956798 RepID=UPI0020B7F401|nr:bifunctional tetrahydrofolate synthase/dihydrofolate synthase [Gilvimarinus sp. DA14]UTF60983.1 bifunctional tetrahydrofolate synthase/dihydrofolate synthase [Gilvimarinus sp. DA14]
MTELSLAQWLARIERAHPTEIDLGLERTQQVYKTLNLPRPPKVLTVAGTNGKGSCVALASALLQTAGLKVGAYTSPHLHHYCERVQINGASVSDADMCLAFQAIERARGDISLTYFEFGTLAALWLFADKAVDVAVLEVGLGGRLDAVNIIDADVAVITSVALDHEAWLGNDRETIGREKAGVARAGQPLVCADPNPPLSVQRYAEAIGAKALWLGEHFHMQKVADCWQFSSPELTISFPAIKLPANSVAAAVMAVAHLGVALAPTQIAQCVARVNLTGRMQTLEYQGRRVVLDVAHNPAATTHLLDNLSLPKAAKVHWVFAIMADKDIAATVEPLLKLPGCWYLPKLPGVERAAAPQVVAQTLAQAGAQVREQGEFAHCLAAAVSQAEEDDLVVILGSFFTVAAALDILQPQADKVT